MNSTKRNVALLAACQALLFTNNSTLIAINGLAGLALAPYIGLATLPVTCWVLGGAIGTMPASLHMKRVGRQRGLITGTLWGIVGALICTSAIWAQSFWLLCFGTLVFGVYNAYGQYYRFAAADVATGDFKAVAISLVLAGGLVGGILGPSASRLTVELVGPRMPPTRPPASTSEMATALKSPLATS
ncbi:MAG TPA: MFS transporter, partial [Burkholderiales bacterium]|nr:MFS transporter [Burkholderiales bacterium]